MIMQTAILKVGVAQTKACFRIVCYSKFRCKKVLLHHYALLNEYHRIVYYFGTILFFTMELQIADNLEARFCSYREEIEVIAI